MVVCLIHCALRNHYKTCCESKVLVLIGPYFSRVGSLFPRNNEPLEL